MPTPGQQLTLRFVLLWAVGSLATWVGRERFGLLPPAILEWGLLVVAVQVAVLAAIVRWHWWWGAATLAAVALLRFVPSALGGAEAMTLPVSLALIAVSALPQWVVLRRHGRPGVAWVGVQPVAAVAEALVYAETQNVYAAGFAAAVLEGVALGWILRPDLQTRAAAATAHTHRAEVREPLPYAAGATMALLAALALFGLIAAFLLVRDLPLRLPDVTAIAAAAAPFVAALLLLRRPRLAHSGFTLAAVSALAALLALAPLRSRVLLLARVGPWRELPLYFVLALEVALLVTVVVQGVRGARAVPVPRRSTWGWTAAWIWAIPYLMVLSAAFTALAH